MFLFWNFTHVVIFYWLINVSKAFKPPSGLQAIVMSPHEIVVKWTEHKRRKFRNDTLYILRYRHSAVPFTLIDVTVPYFVITDALPNTTYAFGVKFVKGKRRSRWSATVRNTTLAVTEVERYPVYKPRAVKSKSLTPRIVKIKWRRPKMTRNEIHGYRLIWTNGRTGHQRGANTTKRSYVIAGLKPNSTYVVKVQTIADDGRVSKYNNVKFRTQMNAVNKPPTNVTVFAIGTTKIKIRWERPQENEGLVTGYKIQYRRKGVRRGDMCAVNLNAKRQEYTITDLYKDEVYKVRIAAKTNDRTGPNIPWQIVDLEAYRKARHKENKATTAMVSTASPLPAPEVNETVVELLHLLNPSVIPLKMAVNITWSALNDTNGYYEFRISKGNVTVVSLRIDPDDEEFTVIEELETGSLYNLTVKILTESGKLVAHQLMQFKTLDMLQVQIRNYTSVPEVGSLTMTCTVTGKPLPSVLWKKGSQDIDTAKDGGRKYDITYATSDDEVVSNLTLSDVRKSDSGIYRCEAGNATETVFDSFNLSIPERDIVDPLESIGVTTLSPFEFILHIFPISKFLNDTIRYYGTYKKKLGFEEFFFNTTSTQHLIRDLNPGTSYVFSVLATGFVGARPLEMNARTPDLTAVPTEAITAAAVNATTILVRWLLPDAASLPYVSQSVLYRNPSVTKRWGVVSGLDDGSAILSELIPNRHYDIKVMTEAKGLRVTSGIVTGSTFPEEKLSEKLPPTPPADVFIDVQNSSMLITWLQPHFEYMSVVRWYKIKVFRGLDLVQEMRVPSETFSAIVDPIEESEIHTVHVSAVNNNGQSDPVERLYNPHNATMRSANQAVTTLTATPIGPTSVRVNWSPVENEKLTRYLLRYRPNIQVGLNSSDIIDQWVSRTIDSFVIRHLMPDQEYLVSIIPYLDDVDGDTSTVYVRTYTDVLPIPPSNIRTSVNETTFTVNWEPPLISMQNAPLTGYVLFYRNVGASFAETLVLNASQSQHTISGLLQGTVYQVAVAATNVNGTGVLSRWIPVTTATAPELKSPPPPPTNFLAEPHVLGIHMLWTPPSHSGVPIDGYVVGYGRFIPEVYRETVPLERREYTITGLKQGRSYIVSLRTYNVFGVSRPIFRKVKAGSSRKLDIKPNSRSSNNVDINVDFLDDAPVNLKVSESGDEVVTLRISWEQPAGINDTVIAYVLYYSTNQNFTTRESMILINKYTVLRKLAFNTTYYFQVQTQYSGRYSPMSPIVSFTTKPADTTKQILPKPVIKNITSGKNFIKLTFSKPTSRPSHTIRGFILGYGIREANHIQDILPATSKSYNIRDLSYNTTYFLSLRMFNEIGHGEQIFFNATTKES